MSSNERSNDEQDGKQLALDVSATITSAVPYIGGPISNILNGLGTVRRINRVKSVLDQVATDLKDFKSKVTEEYVKTDEFEELLERTLRQAADERSDEKRKICARFLRDDIKFARGTYDEKIRFLRTLEVLQPDHLALLKALSAPPERELGWIGSPGGTLMKRLPGWTLDRIAELVGQTNAMMLTSMGNLSLNMTPQGAAELGHTITPYGRRFLSYLTD